jgi:hypothetical protein
MLSATQIVRFIGTAMDITDRKLQSGPAPGGDPDQRDS